MIGKVFLFWVHLFQLDVVIRGGRVEKRKKKLSKHLKEKYGHTPLFLAENIPWDCKTLIISTGESGALPVLDEVKAEAGSKTNAVLHLTC